MACWHKWSKKWVDYTYWKVNGTVADQMKRCLKCNKMKTRSVK
jgi:hypothetical protein